MVLRRMCAMVTASALALVACAEAPPAPKVPAWTAWDNENRWCSGNIDACVKRCEDEDAARNAAQHQTRWWGALDTSPEAPPPERPTCDMLLVYRVEGNQPYADWRKAHGLKTLDEERAGWIQEYWAQLSRACTRGETHACAAAEKLDARLHPEKALQARVKAAADEVNAALSSSFCGRELCGGNRTVAGVLLPFQQVQANALKTEQQVAEYEKAASDVLQKIADYNAARQADADRLAKMKDEQGPIEQAKADCGAHSIDYCKTKCAGSGALYCFAYGLGLWHSQPPKLTEARAAMQTACDAGSPSGCYAMHQIDADVQQAAQDADNWWSPVESSADEIANANYASDLTLRVSPTLHNQRAVERARLVVQELIRGKYCPAKKEFIKRQGQSEFQRRAADHCANHAPTAGGVGGTSVTLTTQCRASFAIACP